MIFFKKQVQFCAFFEKSGKSTARQDLRRKIQRGRSSQKTRAADGKNGGSRF